jgi:HK97 family phage major capsid protein
MTGGTVAEWVAEGVAPAESDPGFGSVTLSARQLSGSVRVSRKQLRQSLPGIDVLLQNDLRAQFAVTLDRTAIAGAGGLEPFGILNAAGVDVRQVADLGTAGAGLLEFRDLTAMMARVLGKDVPMVSPGFLSSWEVRGRLMSTPRFSQANGVEGPPALQEPVTASGPGVGAETIGGFPARFSSTVPRDLGAGNDRHALIFGDWSQLVVATWGALDLIIDDASEAAAGNVRIAAHLFADIAIRHTEAFAVLDNIDPAATGA